MPTDMTRHVTATPFAPPTLQSVLDKLAHAPWLSDIRRRDLRSAVTGVADLLGQPARNIVVDVPQIGAKLSAVDRMGGARRRSAKTMQNLRSGFVAAVKTTGFMPRRRLAKALRADWAALLDGQSKRRRLGLARLARYASTRGIAPTSINSSVVDAMMADVRAYSLRRNPNQLHRKHYSDLERIGPRAARPPRVGGAVVRKAADAHRLDDPVRAVSP